MKFNTQIKISTFLPIITKLAGLGNRDNVAIGGKAALEIYGLKMTKEPQDIDLIVFSPNEEQKKYVFENLLFFDQIKTRPFQTYPDNVKAIKLKKDGYYMDIIMAHGFEMVDNPCYIFVDNIAIPLNPIDKIIEAKNSYTMDDSKGLQIYARRKDMEDLIDLKNMNFNFDL